MKKKLTLWILLFPALLFAQTQVKDGTLTIDFGKKKKEVVQDTIEKQQPLSDEEEDEEDAPKPKRKKQKNTLDLKDDFDYKRDGLFKGLFAVGLNACQVDGDREAGYKYLGANVSVGAMIRFHKHMSVSMEIGYSMKGARARFTQNAANANFFRTNFDYIEVPIAFNVHDKKLVMFTAGLAVGSLIRYKEFDRATGIEINYNNPPYGQPRKIDLNVFGGLYFIVKKNFALGAKFSYSVLKIRGAEPGTKVNGQYHNVISFRLMYILDARKKKK